jgi:site-specific DNA-cytosine methylase
MVLRVGTDCSGMEAPIQALKNLNIDFKHIFSSEIDASCIETIQANAPTEGRTGVSLPQVAHGSSDELSAYRI